jgi:hypothetical protein
MAHCKPAVPAPLWELALTKDCCVEPAAVSAVPSEHLRLLMFTAVCVSAVPANCPPGVCYNAASKEKFWGFATSIGLLDDLRAGNDSRLDLLKQKHYKWL